MVHSHSQQARCEARWGVLLEACGRVRRAGRGAAAADWLGGRPSGRILARSLRPRAVAGAAYTAVASRVPQQRRGAGRGARGAGRGARRGMRQRLGMGLQTNPLCAHGPQGSRCRFRSGPCVQGAGGRIFRGRSGWLVERITERWWHGYCVLVSLTLSSFFRCSLPPRRPRSFGCGRWSTSTTSSAPSTSASGSKQYSYSLIHFLSIE